MHTNIQYLVEKRQKMRRFLCSYFEIIYTQTPAAHIANTHKTPMMLFTLDQLSKSDFPLSFGVIPNLREKLA